MNKNDNVLFVAGFPCMDDPLGMLTRFESKGSVLSEAIKQTWQFRDAYGTLKGTDPKKNDSLEAKEDLELAVKADRLALADALVQLICARADFRKEFEYVYGSMLRQDFLRPESRKYVWVAIVKAVQLVRKSQQEERRALESLKRSLPDEDKTLDEYLRNCRTKAMTELAKTPDLHIPAEGGEDPSNGCGTQIQRTLDQAAYELNVCESKLKRANDIYAQIRGLRFAMCLLGPSVHSVCSHLPEKIKIQVEAYLDRATKLLNDRDRVQVLNNYCGTSDRIANLVRDGRDGILLCSLLAPTADSNTSTVWERTYVQNMMNLNNWYVNEAIRLTSIAVEGDDSYLMATKNLVLEAAGHFARALNIWLNEYYGTTYREQVEATKMRFIELVDSVSWV